MSGRYIRFQWDVYDDCRAGWDAYDGASDDLAELLSGPISTGERGHIVDLESGKIIYRLGVVVQRGPKLLDIDPMMSAGSAPPFSLGYDTDFIPVWIKEGNS